MGAPWLVGEKKRFNRMDRIDRIKTGFFVFSSSICSNSTVDPQLEDLLIIVVYKSPDDLFYPVHPVYPV
jgi:hypothetical protein